MQAVVTPLLKKPGLGSDDTKNFRSVSNAFYLKDFLFVFVLFFLESGSELIGKNTCLAESNLNSKTLFYKNCSLGSVKNFTTSPC